MNCEILKYVITAFNSLWNCEVVDHNTIRIHTPYASINNKYITLYVKQDNGNFIVSDGGYLYENFLSGDLGTPNIKIFETIVESYVKEFEIELKEALPTKFYYKKTDKLDYLPNCVFEMADFAKNFLSAIYIGSDRKIQDEADFEEKKFYKIAKDYISETFTEESQYKLKYNEKIGFDGRKKMVSLVVAKMSTLNCVQFLSGGKPYNYMSRINNAKSDFELLSDYTPIKSKFALYDDRIEVYEANRNDLDTYLNNLQHVLTKKPIPWSKKEDLLEIFS